MKRILPTVLTVVAIVAALFIAAGWFLFHDQSLTRLRSEGTIRIGYAVEAPYAFLKPGGEITGESPEVAKLIVARLGIGRIEWQQSEFGSLIAGLESGRFDVIAAGMFISPERARRINFSEPSFHVQEALLVPKGNPRRLHSFAQALPPADVKIAVLAGSVEESLLLRLGLPDRQLVRVPDALTGRVAVESGTADGLALSSPTIRWMAMREQLGKTEMAEPFEQSELAQKERLGFGAFVFRKRDGQLQTAWNVELKKFIGSAEHQKLIAEFGFTPNELPGSITTWKILSTP